MRVYRVMLVVGFHVGNVVLNLYVALMPVEMGSQLYVDEGQKPYFKYFIRHCQK
jgi:hypothetical protein